MREAQPRLGAIATAAATAALAGSIAAEALLGARAALTPVALALDLVCAVVAALLWRAARDPGSAWRALLRDARGRPLFALWLAADLALIALAAAAGFGKGGVEPLHWRAVAVYVAARAVSTAILAGVRGGSGRVRLLAGAGALGGVALALAVPPLWRSAATSAALALAVVAAALRSADLPRLALAAAAALPALALAAAAWVADTTPLAWVSPVASASALVGLGLGTFAIGVAGPAGAERLSADEQRARRARA